jgi:hypothetical protein
LTVRWISGRIDDGKRMCMRRLLVAGGLLGVTLPAPLAANVLCLGKRILISAATWHGRWRQRITRRLINRLFGQRRCGIASPTPIRRRDEHERQPNQQDHRPRLRWLIAFRRRLRFRLLTLAFAFHTNERRSRALALNQQRYPAIRILLAWPAWPKAIIRAMQTFFIASRAGFM